MCHAIYPVAVPGGLVYNLFDEDWSAVVSEFVPYGWQQAGIDFQLEVKYSF